MPVQRRLAKARTLCAVGFLSRCSLHGRFAVAVGAAQGSRSTRSLRSGHSFQFPMPGLFRLVRLFVKVFSWFPDREFVVSVVATFCVFQGSFFDAGTTALAAIVGMIGESF